MAHPHEMHEVLTTDTVRHTRQPIQKYQARNGQIVDSALEAIELDLLSSLHECLNRLTHCTNIDRSGPGYITHRTRLLESISQTVRYCNEYQLETQPVTDHTP